MPKLMQAAADHSSTSMPDRRGRTLRDVVAAAEEVPGQTVIRAGADPISRPAAMAVLRGNLAPRGALIKTAPPAPPLLQHTAAPWCSPRSRT